MASSPSYKLAHLSDVHFGKIAHPGVVDALVDEANAEPVDLIVISGDLTQRARTSEYEAAKAMIDAFTASVVVVPGNHDVRAWWHNPIERVFHSASRFRQFIEEDVTPQFARPGLAVFGINSAHGLTIKGGKIRARHLDEMEAFFGAQPAGTFKVLTLHHHLMRLRALGSHDVARGAKDALARIGACGVDLILCGHLHRSHVEHVEIDLEQDHRLVIASAGTATSSRGRGTNQNVNFYNHVCIEPDHFIVEERRFDSDAGRFESERALRFERVANQPSVVDP